MRSPSGTATASPARSRMLARPRSRSSSTSSTTTAGRSPLRTSRSRSSGATRTRRISPAPALPGRRRNRSGDIQRHRDRGSWLRRELLRGLLGNPPGRWQRKTCTITNDDMPPTLTRHQDGRQRQRRHRVAERFTMTINGVSAQGGNSFPGAGLPASRRRSLRSARTTSAESSLPGYTQTSASAELLADTIALSASRRPARSSTTTRRQR